MTDRETGDAPPGVPRWVKLLGVLLLLVLLVLAGGRLLGYGVGPGQHGPGQHGAPATGG